MPQSTQRCQEARWPASPRPRSRHCALCRGVSGEDTFRQRFTGEESPAPVTASSQADARRVSIGLTVVAEATGRLSSQGAGRYSCLAGGKRGPPTQKTAAFKQAPSGTFLLLTKIKIIIKQLTQHPN